ncbi:MAG: hypothetical protein F9K40_03385 [Kofleriaceae bacterium]|nr:MAG: hypothetical protein F9K40_03385 [Kofleriaceae bacterium]MBZ0234295.1 hypothetical protein [Kofleriaceae bacterium]
MSYREARELAFLRQALRDRLIAHDVAGAVIPLGRLREVAAAESADHELRAEYERWAFRFELLAA